MFQFAFDNALFEFAQPTPAAAPLFKLPPTRTKRRARRSCSPLAPEDAVFFFSLVKPLFEGQG